MFRKMVVIGFVVVLVGGMAFAQRGRSKDLGGEFFGAEAFLRPLKLVAGTNAPELTLARSPEVDCPPEQVGVICFAIADPNATFTKTLNDVTRIVIPGKSLHDALLIEARNFTSVYYRWDAPYDVPNGLFLYNPTITIESPALAAPITANLGHKRVTRMVHPGEDASEDAQYSRMYRLTRSLMKEGLGLSDDVVENFFDHDITIRLNITLRVRQVEWADALYDFMVFGN